MTEDTGIHEESVRLMARHLMHLGQGHVETVINAMISTLGTCEAPDECPVCQQRTEMVWLLKDELEKCEEITA